MKSLGTAALMAAALAAPAPAQIIALSGDTTVVPGAPPSLLEGALESNDFIYVVPEARNYPLPVNLDVDAVNDGTFPPDALLGGTIAAGIRVNSYLLHADQIGVGGSTSLSGSVTFHGDILGIIVSDGFLDASDPFLGLPVTTYPTTLANRGLDLTVNDLVTVSGNTIKVELEIFNVIDQVRVLTVPPKMMFSLDLGSDAEFGDPTTDGNEWFDCGSVYFTQAMTPGVLTLTLDDGLLAPQPIVPEFPFAAPFGCAGAPQQCYREVFDLDAVDTINVDLTNYLPGPILRAELSGKERRGIFRPRRIFLSFDDDTPEGWMATPGPCMPVDSLSKTGMTYGQTPNDDEVIEIALGGAFPYTLLSSAPRADEMDVHDLLAINPDQGQRWDDDVDALDAVLTVGRGKGGPMRRPFRLFSADHEGTAGGLEPGTVYMVDSTGVTPVVPYQLLGLEPRVDVDAFEFVWLPLQSSQGPMALALLFSVDDDDPLTGADESGGLDANQLYASYMDGAFFRIAEPLRDDVDALACGVLCDKGPQD